MGPKVRVNLGWMGPHIPPHWLRACTITIPEMRYGTFFFSNRFNNSSESPTSMDPGTNCVHSVQSSPKVINMSLIDK